MEWHLCSWTSINLNYIASAHHEEINYFVEELGV
jgi:hypothetical protein